MGMPIPRPVEVIQAEELLCSRGEGPIPADEGAHVGAKKGVRVGVGEAGVGVNVACALFAEPGMGVGVALALGPGTFPALGALSAKAYPAGARTNKIQRKFLFTRSHP